MSLRSATMVLREIRGFTITDYDMLYHRSKKINWHKLFDNSKSFRVDVKGGSDILHNSQFVVHRVKDAIADTFKNVTDGVRPSVEKENPDISVIVYVDGKNITVYLNGSGEPLFKRGYRKHKGEAPIKEDLAAGLLILAGYNGAQDLYDPMCGSGTFLIEAAMIADNVPPNLNRKFAFENWLDFDKDIFNKVKGALKAGIKKTNVKIFGSDIDLTNIGSAQKNIISAGFEDRISVYRADYKNTDQILNNYCIITNPPYGTRLEIDAPELFYKELGDFLKNKAKQSQAFIFSGDLSASKKIGLRTEFKKKVYNGPIECRLLKYSLW